VRSWSPWLCSRPLGALGLVHLGGSTPAAPCPSFAAHCVDEVQINRNNALCPTPSCGAFVRGRHDARAYRSRSRFTRRWGWRVGRCGDAWWRSWGCLLR
jgi:hypothetical protein